GIGPRTGARILAEIGDGSAFANGSKLAAYAGLAPSPTNPAPLSPVRPAVGGSRLSRTRVAWTAGAVWSGPDRPDRGGRGDHPVRVVGGFDLLQAVVGGGWGDRGGPGPGTPGVLG